MERREAYRYLVIRIAARGQAFGGGLLEQSRRAMTANAICPAGRCNRAFRTQADPPSMRDAPLRNRLAAL